MQFSPSICYFLKYSQSINFIYGAKNQIYSTRVVENA